ncbi:unnamed protein product [Rotaria sp. Silwood2]|nr:unnamed protein product [Rotaria sp. Silwood2]
MKARKTLQHALLIQQLIQQLNSRFELKTSMIKKCIDILIEDEYIERQPNGNKLLRYLTKKLTNQTIYMTSMPKI